MNGPSLRPHDVAVVHVPFVERQGGRKRPVVVLSSAEANKATGVAIVAMITREDAPPWQGDLPVTRLEDAGLHKPCKIRMKLYTVEIADLAPIGHLHGDDRHVLSAGLKRLRAL